MKRNGFVSPDDKTLRRRFIPAKWIYLEELGSHGRGAPYVV
jgi:hypothetical protein